MFEKDKKQNKKGFTLMEVLVAMSVIIIGLTAALGLIAFTISSGTQSKNRLIAINLAQEGIEIIRNIRDNKWRNDWEWDEDIKNISNKRIDYNDYNDDNDPENFKLKGQKYNQCLRNKLKLDEDDGYQYDTGNQTIFSRCINTSSAGGADKIQIISEVTVKSNKGEYTVKVVAYLYDWKK